jgi:hypothetical protein
MQKWEYTMANFPESPSPNSPPNTPDLVGLLNLMGQQGWELISFVHFAQAKLFQCVFKRPFVPKKTTRKKKPR